MGGSAGISTEKRQNILNRDEVLYARAAAGNLTGTNQRAQTMLRHRAVRVDSVQLINDTLYRANAFHGGITSVDFVLYIGYNILRTD